MSPSHPLLQAAVQHLPCQGVRRNPSIYCLALYLAKNTSNDRMRWFYWLQLTEKNIDIIICYFFVYICELLCILHFLTPSNLSYFS